VSGREAFAAEYGIDDALLARFGMYADALMQAQSQMNLVGPATLADIWGRHFADSAQLLPLGVVGPWLDLGAGAGFPGMVLALLGARVDLVEATGKKANFLEETAAQLGLGDRVRVHHARAELMVPFPVANITARALAILPGRAVRGTRHALGTAQGRASGGGTRRSACGLGFRCGAGAEPDIGRRTDRDRHGRGAEGTGCGSQSPIKRAASVRRLRR